MKIFIPSRGRPNNQKAAVALKEAGVPFHIVCTKDDPTLPDYVRLWGKHVLCLSHHVSLCEKRQHIVRMNHGKICMIDDDLAFYARKRDGKFLKATPKQVRAMVTAIGKALSKSAHVGLVDKFMSQAQPRGTKGSGRYNQVLGFNLDMIRTRAKALKVQTPMFSMPLNQEHDMHLQLLSIGLAPTILCEYSKDAKYYAVGGLKKFRTVKVERMAFKSLAKRWPHYVKLRETKHSISGIAATFNWRVAMLRCLSIQNGLRRGR